MADDTKDEDDMGDLTMLPNMMGLSRLQTDPMQQQQQPETVIDPEDDPPIDEDGLGDLKDLSVLPNLSGLSRLQTDPVQQMNNTVITEQEQKNTNNNNIDVEFDGLPNLSGLSRLQTDPIQQPQITDTKNNENNTNNTTVTDVELIPVFKFCKTPKIIEILENGIDTDFINWNIFDLHEIADHYTLSICTNYLFNKLDLFSKLNINQNKLLSFVAFIEKGYLNIPYHNSLHGTDVMVNAFHYLIKSGLIISDLDKMIILIAALCHDYKHPGLQSTFLVDTKNEITMKYNGKSILEQMHIAETMKILNMEKYNFLQDLEENKIKYVKQCINDMILGTDLAIHGEHIKKLDEMVTECCNDDKKKEDEDDKNKLDIMIIGLHAADVGSICKSWILFEKWGIKIFEEWFFQGDKEKELGMEISKGFDREKDVDKISDRHSQFITYLMLPFYEKWSSVFSQNKQFDIWCKQLIDNNAKLKTQGISYKQ